MANAHGPLPTSTGAPGAFVAVAIGVTVPGVLAGRPVFSPRIGDVDRLPVWGDCDRERFVPHVNRLSRHVRGGVDRRCGAAGVWRRLRQSSFFRLIAVPGRGLRPALVDDISGPAVRGDHDRPGPHADLDRLSRRVRGRVDRRHRAGPDVGDVDGPAVRGDRDPVGLVVESRAVHPDCDRRPGVPVAVSIGTTMDSSLVT
jgi:hypothetical protein